MPSKKSEIDFPVINKNIALTLSLIVIVIFWALYANFSKYNLDTYRDMLENYSWGIRWQWGNSKHPPVFGWITAAWFEIFPRTNLAYRFLSSINIGVSLALMLLISSRYLNKNQQLATLAVALGLPLLGFVALDYNANSAMIPFWVASFLFYLRVLEKPNLIDGLALGLFAGLAMMV
ncbi:MAG: glycosyltransferase family 39 protein, partial [Pseudomonadota bacterium]